MNCDKYNHFRNLEWETISYHEELDADNRTVIHIEVTQEAPYRGGYLVREILQNGNIETISQSIAWVPGV